jgi:hypothetical protein
MAAISLPRRLLVGGGTVKQIGGLLKGFGLKYEHNPTSSATLLTLQASLMRAHYAD